MPPGGIGLPGTAPRPRNELEYIVRTDTAIFAEVTFDLNDTLSLTVGGRETEEEFEFATMVPENPLGPPHSTPTNVNGTVRLTDGVPTQGTRDFNKFTPRISLQNQFTDTIMGYISYSEGFNGGGVNSRFDPLLPDNGITPFEGEVLKNIELGLRSDLADGRLRLNATAFTGTWEDIQIGEVLTPGTTTTTNAGEAEIEGLEIEGIWRATDNLAINFTYGSLDTRYTDVGSAVVISTNSRFAFAPETSYSIGFRHDASLEGGGTLTTSLEYGWIDDFETFRNDEFQVSAHNGDYGLLSGRVMWTPAQGNWDFSVFGTNLTDEYYRMGGFPAILAGVDQGVVARPRELGVTLRLRL
jgi:iron complex outermembrane receptor protein